MIESVLFCLGVHWGGIDFLSALWVVSDEYCFMSCFSYFYCFFSYLFRWTKGDFSFLGGSKNPFSLLLVTPVLPIPIS